ncbi:hypothetical protein ElyMa_004714600 [Elysia marginata]|uniref:Uncharacterized protein n=1 Tax=Elysia marginata TaxID=1093978 RepID=A0AAV4I9V3_9GAST|nr:hypothetical protein ElyMa_004714600 [Elysia marginata]
MCEGNDWRDTNKEKTRFLLRWVEYIGILFKDDRLCGLAVRHSLRDQEVRGSIPGRVKPRTLKLVQAADPPSAWHYGFSAKSGGPGVRIM